MNWKWLRCELFGHISARELGGEWHDNPEAEVSRERCPRCGVMGDMYPYPKGIWLRGWEREGCFYKRTQAKGNWIIEQKRFFVTHHLIQWIHGKEAPHAD